jgi:hypothetical protein
MVILMIQKLLGLFELLYHKINHLTAYEVIWLREGEQIKQSRYFRMTEEGEYHTLRISEAFAEDEGMYKCVAGSVSTSAKLKVIGKSFD